MSDSNWRGSYTVGLIVAGLAAAVFAGWLWLSTENSQLVVEQQAAKGAKSYTDPGNTAVEGKCLSLPPAASADCITTEREASYEGQRKERDLEAQRIVAVWTRTVGIATIVGMAFGIFGLSLIFVTFWETRKAADAGRKANQIALQAQRPWLLLDTIKYEPRAENGHWDFALVLKNFGLSPARDVIIKTGWQITTAAGGTIPHEIETWPDAEMAGIVGPNATALSYHIQLSEYQIANQSISICCIAEYKGHDRQITHSTEFRIVTETIRNNKGQFALRWHPVGRMNAT